MADTACTVIAREKDHREKTHVVQQTLSPLEDGQVRLRVDLLGLSANNKFYMDFGEDSTFCFNSAYPIVPQQHQEGETSVSQLRSTLVAIPAWGLATVVESKVPEIVEGQKFRGFLHLTDTVQFTVKVSDEGFTVARDKLLSAYNNFTEVSSGPLGGPKGTEECGIALATWPGSFTGFFLCEFLKKHAFYGAKAVVFTSASSKVSLAAAYFLKRAAPDVKLVGWTSHKNKEFCLKTDQYDSVFDYDEDLDKYNDCVLVDVAGKSDLYMRNEHKFLKAFAVGNSNDVPEPTFTQLGFIATLKMMLALMGFKWLLGWLNPKLEFYLVLDTLDEMKSELGHEELNKRLDEAMTLFVDAVLTNKLMSVRFCDNLTSIQQAQNDICKGLVPPSEAIVLDMVNAVQSRH